MKVLKKSEEFDLKTIFGEKLVDKWELNYPILKNKDVERWIQDKIDKYTDEGKSASGFNVPSYLNPLNQYCIYNKTNNPSELLNEDIDHRNLRLKKYLKDFLLNEDTTLEDVKALGFKKIPSEVSVRNLIQSRIKSFYSNRGASVSYNLKSKKSGANLREITLTKEIIKKIQSRLESKHYRLICKFESQTGLRIGDIVEEIPSGKYIVEKHKERYYIRSFKTIKRNVIINFLFFTKELEDTIKSVSGLDDLTKLDLTTLFKTRRGNRVKKGDYLKVVKNVVKDMGIKGNIKTHSFRKYYIGIIGRNQDKLSDPRIITHFEGHEAPYNDRAYLRIIQDIESYYNEWLKLEKCICIDCILIDKTNKEIVALKEENLKLKEQIDLVIKDKMDFEKTIKEEIAKANGNNVVKDFAKSIMKAIENHNEDQTEFMQTTDSEENPNEDLTMDIYASLIVRKLFESIKKD